MDNWLDRTSLLIGKEGIEKLKNTNVLIVGIGGVGSYAAEFLVRSGVGNLTIVDGDDVDNTNRNRQLPALVSTVGKSKIQVMADRLLDINPDLNITTLKEFINPERATEIVDGNYDYVMDCIDSIAPKLSLLIAAKRKRIKVISAMGAGGKTDPSKVKVTDISKTYHDMLSKNIRKKLKAQNIDKGVKVVFSSEALSKESLMLTDNDEYKRSSYGTVSYMPALFGLYASAEVIRYLLGLRKV